MRTRQPLVLSYLALGSTAAYEGPPSSAEPAPSASPNEPHFVDRDRKPFDVSRIERALDDAMRTSYNTTLLEVIAAWRAALKPYLEAPPKQLEGDNARAIRALFAARDEAIRAADVDRYRATLDGFYCTGGRGGEARLERARREANGTKIESRVREILDGGSRSMPVALVRFEESTGGLRPVLRTEEVERFSSPSLGGWRFRL